MKKFLLFSSNKISFSLQNSSIGIFKERASEKVVEGKLLIINFEFFKTFSNDLLSSIFYVFLNFVILLYLSFAYNPKFCGLKMIVLNSLGSFFVIKIKSFKALF